MAKADDFLGPEPKRADDFLGRDMPSENPGFLERLKRNYQSEVNTGLESMSEGARRAMGQRNLEDLVTDKPAPTGWDRALGAGEALLGGVGYVASPLTSLTKTVVTDPVKVNAKNLGLPEGAAEFLGETAGAASDVFSGAGFAKAAPKLAKVATSAERAVKPVLSAIPKVADKVMSLDELKAAKNAAYDQAKQAGVVVKPEAFKAFVDGLEATMRREGYNPKLHSNVAPVLEDLRAAADQPTQKTLEDIEILRRVASAGRSAADVKNKDQLAKSYAVLDSIDDFLDNLQPHHLLSGDSEAAVTALKEARKLTNKSKKIEDIEEIVRAGEDLEDPRYIQNQFKSIVKNEKRFNRYNEDEQKILKKIANSSLIEKIGRAGSPSGPDAFSLIRTSLASGLGLAVSGGNPVVAAAVPAAATGIRIAGNAARRSNIKELENTISRGEAAPGFLDRFRAERAKMRMTEP